MKDRMLGYSTGFILVILHLFGGSATVFADDPEVSPSPLKLIANTSDMKAMMMAVGLNSLAKLRIDDFDIETIWVGETTSFLDSVTKNDGHLQLVDLDRVDASSLGAQSELRAVMRLWRSERSGDEERTGVDPGHLLVADAAVPPTTIERLLDAIQTDQRILRGAGIDLSKLDPSISMIDQPIPQHQGALDYLAAHQLLSNTAPPEETVMAAHQPEPKPRAAIAPAPDPAKALPDLTKLDGKSFKLYFDTDDAALDRSDMTSVAEACRYAATLPKARFVIAGHADTVGSVLYNTYLSKLRAESTAKAIQNDPRFREALSVVEFGEARPEVPTDDEVSEPMNRRVEITVVQAD